MPTSEPEPSASGPFRRSLFIMLMVLGLITASSLIYARQAASQASASTQRSNALQHSLDELVARQARNDQDRRNSAAIATADRDQQALRLQAQAVRLEEMQTFLTGLLKRVPVAQLDAALAESRADGLVAPRLEPRR